MNIYKSNVTIYPDFFEASDHHSLIVLELQLVQNTALILGGNDMQLRYESAK